jgi:hypothetical protein
VRQHVEQVSKVFQLSASDLDEYMANIDRDAVPSSVLDDTKAEGDDDDMESLGNVVELPDDDDEMGEDGGELISSAHFSTPVCLLVDIVLCAFGLARLTSSRWIRLSSHSTSRT